VKFVSGVSTSIVLVTFDLLYLKDRDIRKEPLVRRKGRTAARRSTDRRRIGLPPGGCRGPPSSSQSASRMSSMETGARFFSRKDFAMV
jgi:hypothetical protein